MMAGLRALWTRLAGGGGEAAPAEEAGEAEEYKGFAIRPAPFAAKGGFQTAGIISKEVGGAPREHRFVRAETLPTRDEAASYALQKARRIIDEQGERLFGPP